MVSPSWRSSFSPSQSAVEPAQVRIERRDDMSRWLRYIKERYTFDWRSALKGTTNEGEPSEYSWVLGSNPA